MGTRRPRHVTPVRQRRPSRLPPRWHDPGSGASRSLKAPQGRCGEEGDTTSSSVPEALPHELTRSAVRATSERGAHERRARAARLATSSPSRAGSARAAASPARFQRSASPPRTPGRRSRAVVKCDDARCPDAALALAEPSGVWLRTPVPGDARIVAAPSWMGASRVPPTRRRQRLRSDASSAWIRTSPPSPGCTPPTAREVTSCVPVALESVRDRSSGMDCGVDCRIDGRSGDRSWNTRSTHRSFLSRESACRPARDTPGLGSEPG